MALMTAIEASYGRGSATAQANSGREALGTRQAEIGRIFTQEKPVPSPYGPDGEYRINFRGCGGNVCAHVDFVFLPDAAGRLDSYRITGAWALSLCDYSREEFREAAGRSIYAAFCRTYRRQEAEAAARLVGGTN